MRAVQDRAAGGLVDTATFHPDESIFDHIDAPDPMPRTDRVERGEQRQRRHHLAIEGFGRAAPEGQFDVFRAIGGRLRDGRLA